MHPYRWIALICLVSAMATLLFVAHPLPRRIANVIALTTGVLCAMLILFL